MSDADDQLDVIAAQRAVLSDALKQATSDSDKQKILDKLGDLQDLQNKIIFDQFQNAAAAVAAMTDNLKAIIRDLQGHIDNLFIDKLTTIGATNGLLKPGTTSGGTGGAKGGATGGAPGGAAGGAGTSGGAAAGGGSQAAGGGAPAAGGGQAGGASGSAVGSVNERGIDCAMDCTSSAANINRNGLQFVARYYRGHSNFPALTAAEAAALSSANLKIVTVWESASDKVGHFSHSTGVDEGTSAYRQALVVGQPPHTPIYFAVDFDADSKDIAGPITDYFRGVADGFNTIGKNAPVYAVGVYGSGLTCATLLAHGLATFSWLAMSTGWRGSKTFNDWNLKQSSSSLILGMDHDADQARPGYGGFRVTA